MLALAAELNVETPRLLFIIPWQPLPGTYDVYLTSQVP